MIALRTVCCIGQCCIGQYVVCVKASMYVVFRMPITRLHVHVYTCTCVTTCTCTCRAEGTVIHSATVDNKWLGYMYYQKLIARAFTLQIKKSAEI